MVCIMTKEEKEKIFKPKWYALYEDDKFICSYPSHKAAKYALHKKIVKMKKYPYDFADIIGYSIKPYIVK